MANFIPLKCRSIPFLAMKSENTNCFLALEIPLHPYSYSTHPLQELEDSI